MRRISSDLEGMTLDLSGGENITELCKRKKIKRAPAVSYNFQKPYLYVHDIYIKKIKSVSLLSHCVSMCVFM